MFSELLTVLSNGKFLFVCSAYFCCVFAVSSPEQKQKYPVTENNNFLHMQCLDSVVVAACITIRRKKKKKKKKNSLKISLLGFE